MRTWKSCFFSIATIHWQGLAVASAGSNAIGMQTIMHTSYRLVSYTIPSIFAVQVDAVKASLHSFAFTFLSTSVTAALLKAGESRSFTFAAVVRVRKARQIPEEGDSLNITLSPSFHISVTSVSPGMTVPANRTLISLYGPYVFKTCLPANPMKQRPCRTATRWPIRIKCGRQAISDCQ